MRGKATGQRQRPAPPGIIPAGAGKRSTLRRPTKPPRDHPRGCGEKSPRARLRAPHAGSSPRVRGKANVTAAAPTGDGIIPAGAGKSHTLLGYFYTLWDHPRGCGEKGWVFPSFPSLSGSSPRVRGKGAPALLLPSDGGIIPAGAGKSLLFPAAPPRYWDHPRGCGEKLSSTESPFRPPGSSPRVRGKGTGAVLRVDISGIIPAGAGKRHHRLGRHLPLRDHPRGCGEKPNAGDFLLGGKDHPRGCGEKVRGDCAVGELEGSSPRVRGKARKHPSLPPPKGIIPAGAGKR